MRYYVLYEFYSEYNQFEGSWDNNWESFATLEEAEKLIKVLDNNGDYRNVIGPLFLLKLGDV